MIYPGRVVTIGTETVFQPALGERRFSEGNLISEEVYARYWSSIYTQNSTGTGVPQFSAHRADAPSTEHPNGRLTYGGVDSDRGYTVRCVRQEKKVVPGVGAGYPTPAFNHIIAIGSDGKLTVTAEDNDKDARLVYFKFGSVIALSCANKWSSKEVAYNPSKLSLDDLNTWDGVPYLKGSTVVVSVLHNAQTVSEGMGDPCRLVGLAATDISSGKVDNKKWRLPTQEDHEGVTAKPLEENSYIGFDEFRGYKGRYITLANSAFPNSVFYSVVGTRDASGVVNVEMGFYMSSISYYDKCSTLSIDYNSVSGVMHTTYVNHGFTVRCVPQ